MKLLKTALILLMALFVIACEQDYQQPVHEYAINNPADIGSRYPNLYVDDTGAMFMSWTLGVDEDIYALQYAKLAGWQWDEARSVRVSADFFVNWADFPSVVGNGGEPVAAHWLRKVDGGPMSYHVNLAFPGETVRRWSSPIRAHLDDSPTEHGFVSMEAMSEDRVLAIWLDGRHTDERGHHEYSDPDKSMTLRSAEISADGEITRKNEIDSMVCDCCQTDLVPVDGGYLAVYRGRTIDEVRDILIARYDTETGEWTEPRTVHDDGWQIGGCPVNGPRIAADGDNVAVAWFTMADDIPKVLLARSTDGGETFEEPIVIAEDNHNGRVDLAIGDEGSVFVSWMDRHEHWGNIMFREVRADGRLSQPVHIGVTSSTRASGFPRFVKMDDYLVFAWTQTEPLIRVRTARIQIGSWLPAEDELL